MTRTALPSPPLLYVESDLADDQTLSDWRSARRSTETRGSVHRMARRAVGLR